MHPGQKNVLLRLVLASLDHTLTDQEAKPEGEVAHAFRHTYAKGLVSRGFPLSAVQALLGHASLQTTQVPERMGAELVDAAQAAEVRDALRATRDGGDDR